MVTRRRPRNMEKSGQKKVQYMKEPWIDTKLSQEEMTFLNHAISKENKENWNHDLAGNISKSELIEDKDNWFYETTLKKLTERLFYGGCNNYYEDYIEKENPPPKFEMFSFWVNYMKQHEFNPIHNHTGLYSFVIFMKIPTHWEEQHALPFSANSAMPLASNFVFMWSEKGTDIISNYNLPLSPEDEGRMLFFPAWLVHQVYPFYECEEERITISGNIDFYDPNRPKKQEGSVSEYEEKKKMLEMMENAVDTTKKELKKMKKAGKMGG